MDCSKLLFRLPSNAQNADQKSKPCKYKGKKKKLLENSHIKKKKKQDLIVSELKFSGLSYDLRRW